MLTRPKHISPKQAARAIGVSESSLKRWCDQGVINSVRTAGGHRKLPVADVLQFIREHNQKLVVPEVLGLPAASVHGKTGLEKGRANLVDALLSGDEHLARQIVFDLYLANHSPSIICDKVIASAFHEIGERWACHAADVYQERRGTEIALRTLIEMRRLQRPPEQQWLAIGGTIEGDQYALPSSMVEVVLRDVGFRAVSLGASLPFASLRKAVEETRPKLFWLSVSHISDAIDFVAEFATLAETCSTTGTALVVGGRALTAELRHSMTYAAFCDTMQHLEGFAKTISQKWARTKIKRTPKKSKSKSPSRLRGK